MQLRSFKKFIVITVKEGNRLQRYDITGKKLTRWKFTQIQLIAIFLSALVLFAYPMGYSHAFAGYTISFLGIFIGLFTSVIITMFDKKDTFFKDYKGADQIEKSDIKKIKNYFLQFTGLTSYSIFIALLIVLLLTINLLNEELKLNPFEYHFVSVDEINYLSVIIFFKIFFTVCYRFLVAYLLLIFFAITIYSITSYFSFLFSEYKKIKLHDNEI